MDILLGLRSLTMGIESADLLLDGDAEEALKR
jgi:hypothetical protein